jgi:hypothetical protein
MLPDWSGKNFNKQRSNVDFPVPFSPLIIKIEPELKEQLIL